MTISGPSADDLPEPMERVQVAPDEGYAANRANWDGRARVHLGSVGYAVEELVADPQRLTAVTRRDVGLWRPHLPPVSLDIARELADRAGHAIRYVEANVLEAAAAVGEQVDLVYTSTGTICWVQDLATWGRQVAALLRPGGTFFFRDSHPSANALADHEPRTLAPGYRYFPLPAGQAMTYADGVTYTDGDQSLITQPRNYEWPHSVSEVLMALVRAGLDIIEVDEQDDLPWPLHPAMTAEGEAYVCLPPGGNRCRWPGRSWPASRSLANRRGEPCAWSGRAVRLVGESSCAWSGRVVRPVSWG